MGNLFKPKIPTQDEMPDADIDNTEPLKIKSPETNSDTGVDTRQTLRIPRTSSSSGVNLPTGQ